MSEEFWVVNRGALEDVLIETGWLAEPVGANPVNQETLATLQWDLVLAKASALADTPMGHDAIKHMPWITDPKILHYEQRLLEEMLQWTARQPLTLRGVGPVGPIADRAHKGHMLSAEDLLVVSSTVNRASEVMETVPSQYCGTWQERISRWVVPLELVPAIESVLTPEGDVKDDASPVLRQLRRKRRLVLAEIDATLQQLLHAPNWAPYLQEAVVTVRFGRRVVPVKYMFRNAVPGIVHDQSASGQSVFVEPLIIVERQNSVVTLEHEEQEEVERILRELSGRVGQYHEDLTYLHGEMERLDKVLGVTRYGTATNSVIPTVDGDQLILVGARHPLLSNPVPLGLQLGEDRRILVITGPNTGGKTVALKTAGLMVALAMSGMMVLAQEGTRIPFITTLFADIGDEQSLEQNLSTFASHIRRLVPMVSSADEATLCLIDELGAGTDPEEGSALAESILETLSQHRALVMATTHYNRLKLLGFRDRGVVNAHVAFNTETLQPTYHLVMGQPGSSHALKIAERLGMPEMIVQRARGLMSEEGLALSEAIASVNQLDADLRQTQKALSQERRQWDLERKQWQEEQGKILERLDQDRKRLRDIWGRELEGIKAEMDRLMADVRRAEGQERARAIENLRSTWRQRGDMPQPLRAKMKSAGPTPTATGDWVRIQGFSDLGHILQIEGPTALIEVGSLRIRLPLAELEKATQPPVLKPRRVPKAPQPAAQHLEIDVRGQSGEEAWDVVDRFLDNAVLAGWPRIRVIHGKGTGTLRRILGERLKQDPRVVSTRLGAAGEGGDGVTIAWLEEEPT